MPRMLIRAPLALLALVVLLLSAGACASTSQGDGNAEGRVAVRVENNLIPPAPITVWAQPRIGTRSMVGVVAPSETKLLSFNPVGAGSEYVLVAEVSAGRVLTSNPINISGSGTVVWNLSSNIATVR